MSLTRAGLSRLLSRRREVLSRCASRHGCLASALLQGTNLTSSGKPSSSLSDARPETFRDRGAARAVGAGGGAPVVYQSRGLSSAAGGGGAPGKKGETIYLHHTDVGKAVNSAGVTIGLFNALQALSPGAGYFRPIDVTSHGGRRAELIRDIFGIKTPLGDMIGSTQAQAFELISSGRLDDLFELILPAFERCKAQHDYLVVEGTSMRDGSNTSPINGLLAATLGCPAILLNDAEAASMSKLTKREAAEGTSDWEGTSWEKDAVGSVVDHSRIMQINNVDVSGALFYRTPKTTRGTTRLRALTEKAGISFLGAIPEDNQLEALQLEDVRKMLDAEVIYGTEDDSGAYLATDINRVVVATLHLEDFLAYIPDAAAPTEGALVVTHASRPDILLGCIMLHETSLPTHVAGIILTGGSYPPQDVDMMLRARPTPITLPVLLSSTDTGSTVMAIAEAQGGIYASSKRKIERSEVLFQENVDMRALNAALFKEKPMVMNAKMFQHHIFSKARAVQQHIVLPEGEEPRTVQAAGELMRRGLARLTMLGDPGKILAAAKQYRVDLSGADLVEPATSPLLDELAEMVHTLRKNKGVTKEHALEMLSGDVTFFGTAMVASGYADGMVSGAIHTTAATVRPALQIIKTLPDTPIVSSVFFMCLPDKVLVYGDCAVNENPTPEELAAIAISSADTAAAFGIEPRVAMLSYATGDSNTGPIIQKVTDATAIARARRPDLKIEGPLQYDAAVNPETAKTKMKGKETEVAGKATVLIFPDLNTGNNTYKAVQQSTGAVAMGPVLQGLKKPVNDLSRGCTVKDIVTTVAITALQAYAMKESQ